MTIIAAYTDGKTTWIGSDCAANAANIQIVSETGKWVIHAGWGIGISGSHRYANAIEAHADKLFNELDDSFELTIRLAKLFRKCGGRPTNGEEDLVECWGVSGLIAKAGFIWDMDETLSIIPWPQARLAASGSGSYFAMGAAWAFQKDDLVRAYHPSAVPLSPDYLLRKSLECACALDNHCAGIWQGKLEKISTPPSC